MSAANGFDMSTVVERAAIVQVSLLDDITDVINKGRTTIPSGLDIARRANVVIGATHMAAPRIAANIVARYLMPSLFQQLKEFEKLGGEGRMHCDIEPIDGGNRHHLCRRIAVSIYRLPFLGYALVMNKPFLLVLIALSVISAHD